MVSWYLGFLSGFPIHKHFEEDLEFLCSQMFFKIKQLLSFLGFVYIWNEDRTEILFFFFSFWLCRKERRHSTYQQDIMQNIIEVSHICRLVSFYTYTQNLPNLFQLLGEKTKEQESQGWDRKPSKCATLICWKQKPWFSELYVVCECGQG